MRASDAQRCVSVCEDVFRLLTSGDYLMGWSSGNSHGMGPSARSTWGHLARGASGSGRTSGDTSRTDTDSGKLGEGTTS